MKIDLKAKKYEERKIDNSLLRAHEYRTNKVEKPKNKRDSYASMRQYDNKSIHKKNKSVSRSHNKQNAIQAELENS